MRLTRRQFISSSAFPVTTTALRVLCLRGPSRQPEFVRVNEIEIYSAISAGPEPTDTSAE
jgi:hypothetical protein